MKRPRVNPGGSGGLLAAALDYAARGWSIVPIRPQRKRDGSWSKKTPPRFRWKRWQTERATPDLLRAWFADGNMPALAVLMGKVSGGLACRDFDVPEAYTRWAAAHPDLCAVLPTVRTPRGWHVYFRAEREHFEDCGDGEYRGTCGHYCVLPPSACGDSRYAWHVPLPAGDLPLIDPVAAGLLAHATEQVGPDATEQAEQTEQTEARKGGGGRSQAKQQQQSKNTAQANKQQQSSRDVLAIPGVLAAVESTLPDTFGTRHRRIFELARAMKAIPELAEATAAALRPAVKEWHRRALPNIRTTEFAETWADFITAWPRVRYPRGMGVADALRRADEQSVPLVALELDYPPHLRRLVALCRELQRDAGDGPFYLACRTAERLLGIDHATAGRWFRVLLADGVLECIESQKWQRGAWRARRLRYLPPDGVAPEQVDG